MARDQSVNNVVSISIDIDIQYVSEWYEQFRIGCDFCPIGSQLHINHMFYIQQLTDVYLIKWSTMKRNIKYI